jgi:flagellar biosynthetic protein FliR
VAISVGQAQIFFLVLTRILATIVHVPVLGGRTIPNQVKIPLGILLALIMLPVQPQPSPIQNLSGIAFGLAMGKEVFIGTIAGFAAVLTFGALQIAGHLMGLVSGFGSGQILNPAIEDNGTSLDQIFVMTSFLIFLVINGHHLFLLGLQKTFSLVPVNSAFPVLSMQTLIKMSAGFITSGVQMSLPILGTLLLTDLTLGLLARVAPQVHVFFLGIPLKIGVGLLALALAIVILLPNLNAIFGALGNRTLELLGG